MIIPILYNSAALLLLGVTHQQAPLSLYPSYNPLEPFPSANVFSGPPPPPQDDGSSTSGAGHEVRFVEPDIRVGGGDEDRGSDKHDDMDISEKSDSRCTSRSSTKKSTDMDCALTSDEEMGESPASLHLYC